jgi:NADH-quinone oxidoreductase subunit H
MFLILYFFVFVFILMFVLLYFFLDLTFLKVLPPVLPIILIVALFTLLERKILAGIQRRRGPNVVGLFGLLQPFADAFKLIFKETIIPGLSNLLLFVIAPIISFTISLLS